MAPLSTEDCHLLNLAAEFRNTIYEYALADNALIDEYGAAVDSEYDWRFTSYGLVLATRQTYSECFEIYYDGQMSQLKLEHSSFRAAKTWYLTLTRPLRDRLSCFDCESNPFWQGLLVDEDGSYNEEGTWVRAYQDWATTFFRPGGDDRSRWITVRCNGPEQFKINERDT